MLVYINLKLETFPQFPNILEPPLHMASKDRLALLRSWVQKGENAAACEAAIVLEKSHSSRFKKDKELLKVADMVKRGMSE